MTHKVSAGYVRMAKRMQNIKPWDGVGAVDHSATTEMADCFIHGPWELNLGHCPLCPKTQIIARTGERKTMKIVSDAPTLDALRMDIVRFVELRAELQRSGKNAVSGKKIAAMYEYAATCLQSLAEDLKAMTITTTTRAGEAWQPLVARVAKQCICGHTWEGPITDESCPSCNHG